MAMSKRFKDRHDGGRLLAGLLADYADRKDVLVLAIPSGGVPVAAALARELACEMDMLMVRTLNAPIHDPWQLDVIMGAVALGGVRVLDLEVLTSSKVHPQDLERVTAFEQRELDRLQRLYRSDRPFPDLRERTVILTTDAIVIVSNMRAAIEAARVPWSIGRNGGCRIHYVIAGKDLGSSPERSSFRGSGDTLRFLQQLVWLWSD